jgi:ribosomal protein S18 acetylase RimI-like enzyme
MLNIRNVEADDLPTLVAIENLCFSKDEAATKEALKKRILFIKDTFYVAEERGEVLGFINGPVISEPFITDDLFTDSNENPKLGGHQSILGLAVSPNHQEKGIATLLLEFMEKKARAKERKTITLTCKEDLIPFYEKKGLSNQGKSSSQHGGVTWFNMTKNL